MHVGSLSEEDVRAQESSHGVSPMADCKFLIGGHLGERAVEGWIEEERVVAKAVLSTRGPKYFTINLAANCAQTLAISGHGKRTNEVRRSK